MDNLKKSLIVQKSFVEGTQDLIKREDLIETLNQSLIDFNEAPEYGTFKKIKDTVNVIDTYIKDNVKNLLAENNLKSSEGPAGRFTLVKKTRISYNAEDPKADPRVKRILELNKELKQLESEIKEDVSLFKEDINGVITTDSLEVRFYAAKKDKKGKELVVDYVDYEEE